MNKLFLIVVVLISGCAFHREVTVVTKAKDVESMYADGDVDLKVQTNTTFYLFQ